MGLYIGWKSEIEVLKMPTYYSMNYREELRAVEAEIQVYEDILSGKRVVNALLSEDMLKSKIRQLKRYRASIIDRPQYHEGMFDPDFTR